MIGNLGKMYYSTNGSSWTELTGLITASLPKFSFPAIDDSDLASTYQAKVAGTPDNGQFSFELKPTSANLTFVGTYKGVDGTYYKVKYSDGNGYKFQGFLSTAEGDLAFNARASVKCTVEISSAITAIVET